MKKEILSYIYNGVKQRKLRNFLASLSIMIGITAVFTLLSFGLGIQDYVNTLSEESGSDKIFVMAKSIGAHGIDENFFITKDEIDFIDKINGVDEVVGFYFKAAEAKSDGEVKYNWISSIDPDYNKLIEGGFGIHITKGRSLKNSDINNAVLGHNYQLDENIFKRGLGLGDKIEINGIKFEVVGFYNEIGNPADDANIYVINEAMESLYSSIKGKYGFVLIRVQKGINPSDFAESIHEKLRKFKRQEEGKEDFFVQSFDDLLETYGNVINVLNGILVMIAIISVIVAFVNIMNTMYTSVLERTKEIGVMKAVGARNRDILSIFVFESGMLGLIGGAAGVIMGFLISSLGGYLAAVSGYSLLKPVFPLSLVVGCLIFSLLVGTISGILPAKQASKLKPVDSLRYE